MQQQNLSARNTLGTLNAREHLHVRLSAVKPVLNREACGVEMPRPEIAGNRQKMRSQSSAGQF